MKSTRFIRYGILVLLLSFVFIFTACDSTKKGLNDDSDTTVTDEEFKQATDFKTLDNYEVNINSVFISDKTNYIITRYDDKFRFNKNNEEYPQNYYQILSDTQCRVFSISGDNKYGYRDEDKNLFEYDEHGFFMRLFNILFFSAETSEHTYDEQNKCYKVTVTNQTYIDNDALKVSGTTSLYFQNKKLVKVSFVGDTNNTPTSPYSMDATISYNVPDFDLPTIAS